MRPYGHYSLFLTICSNSGISIKCATSITSRNYATYDQGKENTVLYPNANHATTEEKRKKNQNQSGVKSQDSRLQRKRNAISPSYNPPHLQTSTSNPSPSPQRPPLLRLRPLNPPIPTPTILLALPPLIRPKPTIPLPPKTIPARLPRARTRPRPLARLPPFIDVLLLATEQVPRPEVRFVVVVMVMVWRRGPGARKCSRELEAEFAFLGVRLQAVVDIVTVAMIRATALVGFLLLAVFALVPVAPDIVALELAGLVADGEGARRLDGPVGRGVWVVVVVVVFVVGQCDEAGSLGVAPDDGAEGRGGGALARAGAGEVEVRHCFRACAGGQLGGSSIAVRSVLWVYVCCVAMVLQCW
jgi:hypothetical protein